MARSLLFGGLTLLGLTITVFFLAAMPGIPANGDFWDTYPWGKLVVGLVYASITAFVLLAFLHTPAVAHLMARL